MKATEVANTSVNITIDKETFDIVIEDPFRLGNTMSCCYKNHNPRIVIGPHCNFLLL